MSPVDAAMGTLMTTAYYTRTSTTHQKIDSQLPDLQQHAKGITGEAEWYTDAMSGKTMQRPGWDQLMEGVRAGRITRIVVWRLDRIGRTTTGLTALFEELINRKVTLVSLKDGIDLLTPAGRLIANVLASVAQYETEVRASRIQAGIEAAKAKGKTWGGRKEGARYKVTEEKANAAKALHREGKGVSEIARILGLSRPTVYGLIKN